MDAVARRRTLLFRAKADATSISVVFSIATAKVDRCHLRLPVKLRIVQHFILNFERYERNIKTLVGY